MHYVSLWLFITWE